MPDVSLSVANARLVPRACGPLYWPAERLLLVADLHLEKGSSFAGSGWFLPPYDSVETLERLTRAVEETGAERLIALGDSFHDAAGPARMPPMARERLDRLMHRVDWLWLTGNHDGHSGLALGGGVAVETQVAGIMLRHEADRRDARPEISGHFHPKVSVPLRTGRRVQRRCFALAGTRLVLPAYGAYAGGLDIGADAFVAALGAAPTALVPVAGGIVRLAPCARIAA